MEDGTIGGIMEKQLRERDVVSDWEEMDVRSTLKEDRLTVTVGPAFTYEDHSYLVYTDRFSSLEEIEELMKRGIGGGKKVFVYKLSSYQEEGKGMQYMVRWRFV